MKENINHRAEIIRHQHNKWITFVLTFIFLIAPIATFAQQEKEFCWRDSYGRGVGTIPLTCAPGQEKVGLLCYTNCPAGMKRAGVDCHSICPEGLRDDGLFCRAAEYGRGAGYALWNEGKCNQENPQGCEKNGALWYPKCKAGYEAFGCCICRPKKPDCGALGLNSGIDLSCGKKIQIGDVHTGSCPPGQDSDAGLCYEKCKTGYAGVGPVCWGQPPPGWSECGMGAAKDSKTCASIIFGQVAAVGQLAMTVASLGSSTALNAGMSAPQKASKLAKLKQQYSALKVQFDLLRKNNQVVQGAIDTFDAANKGKKGYVAMETAENAVTEEDMIRLAAQIAAIMDPTGISDTVAAFTYPKCSKYGFSPTGETPTQPTTTEAYSGDAPDSMSDGAQLTPEQFLLSQNRRFKLLYQADGNLVLYRAGGGVLWASNTVTNAPGFVAMQGDGNLVIYSNSQKVEFATGTDGNQSVKLVLQNDGNLVIYSAAGKPIFATNTVVK